MLTHKSLTKKLDDLEQRLSLLPSIRQQGLPGEGDWEEYFDTYGLFSAESEADVFLPKRSFACLIAFIRNRLCAPAVWPLRDTFLRTLEAIAAEDQAGHVSGGAPLPAELRNLLTLRVNKWRWSLGQPFFFAPCLLGRVGIPADPLIGCLEQLKGLSRWQVFCWAGAALRQAEEDVWGYWLWSGGGRERAADYHVRAKERKEATPERLDERWAKEVVEHELPPEEAAIVDTWPVPPDSEWPQHHRVLLNADIRSFQRRQAEREGV